VDSYLYICLRSVVFKISPLNDRKTSPGAADLNKTAADERRAESEWADIQNNIVLYCCVAGAFTIPYIVMMTFVGLPVFFLELIIGQYSAAGPLNIWNMSPLFKGQQWRPFRPWPDLWI